MLIKVVEMRKVKERRREMERENFQYTKLLQNYFSYDVVT